MTHQFVIAGCYTEYRIFLESKGLPPTNARYTFISDPLRLHGQQSVQVLCIGAYHKSPVYRFWEGRKYHLRREVWFVNEGGKYL